jgi:hypothetical protein
MNVTPDRVQETKAMSRRESPDFFIIGAPKCGTTALARTPHRLALARYGEWLLGA